MNKTDIIKTAAILTMVTLALTLTIAASDWQQFQYDVANTGNSPADAPDDNTIKWTTADIGAVEGSQAMIAGDRVFVYADTEVYALNKDTGGTLWSTSIWGDTSGYGSWASPAYSDGKLYVSSGYNISRINATDGTLEQLVPFPDGGHSCNGGPTVADGVVYAGSGYGSPAHYYAFDASDLTTVLWSFSVGSDTAGSTPAVAGDRVVFGNGSSLTCVNKADGALLWTTDLSSGTIFGSAAIDSENDIVYVATGSGSLALLHALNLTDGSLIWTGNNAIDFTDGTPAFLDMDHVYISGNAYGSPGHTYCFNGTGVLQWTVPCGSWVMSPAVADGKLFTGDCDDMGGWGFFEGIGAYDALTGALIWEYDYGGSSPSIANPDGMVVSIGKNGVVYAFGNPTPQTPLIISGEVSKADGTPCNDPSVLITNTATGEDWNAETRSDSNYYRLVISSDDVSAGNILRIDASGCSQSTTMPETVSQDEINGGGFSLDITLGPTITSCNDTGAEQNEFYPGENVSVTGIGLAPNTNYTIWIQPDPVDEGDELNVSIDPSGSQETVTTDGSGNLAKTEIWSGIPAGSQKNYDIVVDRQDDGANTGTYNAASDGIDSANGVAGIVAPIPELASIALIGCGLLMLVGLVRYRKE